MKEKKSTKLEKLAYGAAGSIIGEAVLRLAGLVMSSSNNTPPPPPAPAPVEKKQETEKRNCDITNTTVLGLPIVGREHCKTKEKTTKNT